MIDIEDGIRVIGSHTHRIQPHMIEEALINHRSESKLIEERMKA